VASDRELLRAAGVRVQLEGPLAPAVTTATPVAAAGR
jgi:hypothetical protein